MNISSEGSNEQAASPTETRSIIGEVQENLEAHKMAKLAKLKGKPKLGRREIIDAT
jgi:hypothetical protein